MMGSQSQSQFTLALLCVLFSTITYVLCYYESDGTSGQSGAYGLGGYSQQDHTASAADYNNVAQYYQPSFGFNGLSHGAGKYAHKHEYGGDSIIFYEGRYFQGISEPCHFDNPELKLRGRIGSFIVGGGPASRWTLYNGQNYTGFSVCVLPPDVTPFKPALITDVNENELATMDIASVRKGCIPVIRSIDNTNYRLRQYS